MNVAYIPADNNAVESVIVTKSHDFPNAWNSLGNFEAIKGRVANGQAGEVTSRNGSSDERVKSHDETLNWSEVH